MKRINWSTPLFAVASLIIGVLLAIGHDQFYMSLDGRQAITKGRKMMGSGYSSQQLNLAVGTTFAFLFKSALTFACLTAFCQIFWRLARSKSASKQRLTLERLDVAYGLVSNLLSLFHLSFWYQHPALCLVAAVSWYVNQEYRDTD
jgi:hypothetical protein